MQGEGQKNPGSCWIRVFFPNPLPGTYTGSPKNLISEEYEVLFIDRIDPIYHELVFIDKHSIRHRIIGLAYHMREKMADAGGIDAAV